MAITGGTGQDIQTYKVIIRKDEFAEDLENGKILPCILDDDPDFRHEIFFIDYYPLIGEEYYAYIKNIKGKDHFMMFKKIEKTENVF